MTPLRCAMAVLVSLILACAGMTAGVAHAAPTCMEDMPCWTWSTMGNHDRGVTLRNGTRVVVGPCAYARARHAHTIDMKRTPKLRGDAWAMAHGCD